jgi:hypothetical protein
MNNENIRDSDGKIIGKQTEKEIRDNNNRRLGRYDKATDSTFDGNGKFIGKGDQRMRLLG